MEEPQTPAENSAAWNDLFNQALQDQRARTASFLQTQQERLASFEAELTHRFDALLVELEREQTQVATTRAEHDARAVELQQQAEQLTAREAALAREQAALAEAREQFNREQSTLEERLSQREQDLDRRTAELAETQAELKTERTQLAAAQQELELAQAELARQRKRLAERHAELDERQEHLDELEHDTREQRRRIARDLREQRTKQLEEIERQREQLEELATSAQSELLTRLTVAQQEQQSLRDQAEREHEVLEQTMTALEELRLRDAELEAELSAALQTVTEFEQHALAAAAADTDGSEVVDAWQTELKTLRTAHRGLQDELQELRSAAPQQQAALDAERATNAQLKAELAELATHVDRLRQDVADAQQAAPAAASSGTADAEALQEMRRRYELAMEDIRDLKAEREELNERLRSRGSASSGGAAKAEPDTAMDWESQKRRLLAALESDFDEDNSRDVQDRLKIEETIRRTDQVVNEKDRLISQLQQQLAQLVAAPKLDAATTAAIDSDELVRQERERLQQLQKSWEEKLRQAEIDLSVERAKIARQRAELEERIRELETTNPQRDPKDQDSPASGKRQPQRGRWLTRLGLRDENSQ